MARRPNHVQRERRWRWLCCTLAALLTGALYLLDILLFQAPDAATDSRPPLLRAGPDHVPVRSKENLATFIHVPLDEPLPQRLNSAERQRLVQLHRNLRAWLVTFDPTLLSLPNEDDGFSAHVQPLQSDAATAPLRHAELNLRPPYQHPQPPLITVPEDWQAALQAALWQRAPLMRPPGVTSMDAVSTVFWTDATGSPLRLPQPDPAALAAAVESGPVHGPTRLEIRPRARFPRVRVIAGSGNSSLDELVRLKLQRHLTHLQAQQRDEGDPLKRFRPAATVQANWRLHEAVQEVTPPEPESGSERLPWPEDFSDASDWF